MNTWSFLKTLSNDNMILVPSRDLDGHLSYAAHLYPYSCYNIPRRKNFIYLFPVAS